jgi:hypothetical protein
MKKCEMRISLYTPLICAAAESQAAAVLPLFSPRAVFAIRFGSAVGSGSKLIISASRVAVKIVAGQEKGEERISHTVEPFDEPGGDFRRNPKGRGPASRPRK